jgi:hypothetical protein
MPYKKYIIGLLFDVNVNHFPGLPSVWGKLQYCLSGGLQTTDTFSARRSLKTGRQTKAWTTQAQTSLWTVTPGK